MNLWLFLTIAVVVWGIVELAQARSKNNFHKKLESDEDDRKKIEARIERLEHRMGNIEAIVVDEEAGRASRDTGAQEDAGTDKEFARYQTGTLTNKLK